ncbi:MAG: aldo/keto reductase family protein [Candidatus Lokiarchaeota archaeon]|nr:aldo/keto reductase family protein [Candidatus Lokiarchaeota archaeon]
MNYRNIGKSGLKVSEISIGAWLTFGGSVEKEMSKQCISRAIELGVNFIDVADIYALGKAEEVVGEILKEENYRRRDLVISSKVYWPMSENVNDMGLSRKHIMESIKVSLTRLKTDYLDIYFCHRFDYHTPIEETVRTMSNLVEQGLTHYWGTSIWTAPQIERAIGIAKKEGLHPPIVEQPRYNMLDRFIELEVIDTCQYNKMGITCFSPLAGGLLTGKYNTTIPKGTRGDTTDFLQGEMTPDNINKIRNLTELTKELEINMNQLALAWILRLKEVSTAITGATKVHHVESNVKSSEIKLDKDIIKQIDDILDNQPQMPGSYIY